MTKNSRLKVTTVNDKKETKKGLLSSLTNLPKGDPVHTVEATSAQGEADGGADDGVGAGDGQLEEGRHQIPDGAATCRGVTH